MNYSALLEKNENIKKILCDFAPLCEVEFQRSQNSLVRIQNKTEFELKFNSVSCLLTPEFLVLKFLNVK